MRQVYNKELQIRLAEPAGLLVRLKGVQFYCNLDHVIIFLDQVQLAVLRLHWWGKQYGKFISMVTTWANRVKSHLAPST